MESILSVIMSCLKSSPSFRISLVGVGLRAVGFTLHISRYCGFCACVSGEGVGDMVMVCVCVCVCVCIMGTEEVQTFLDAMILHFVDRNFPSCILQMVVINSWSHDLIDQSVAHLHTWGCTQE